LSSDKQSHFDTSRLLFNLHFRQQLLNYIK
jgi:hypothetical protein